MAAVPSETVSVVIFVFIFTEVIPIDSKKKDLAHKLMILKAAGKMENYVNVADPGEIIQIFAVSVN